MDPVPDTEREVTVDDLNRARTAEESGGGGGGKDYKRDNQGEFSSVDSRGGKPQPGKPQPHGSGPPRHKPTSKSPPKPIVAIHRQSGPMKRGGDNDPEQVKQLQALLGVLGLGKPSTDGNFDFATEQAVREAQQRLGLKATGRVSTALLNKLITAHSLSPCVQRSAGMDEYELLRAAVERGDYDDDEDSDQGRPVVTDLERCCPDVYDDESHVFRREWNLDGIDIIRSGQGGDGRTVDAYATVFGTPAEIKDQHGHYNEVIHRGAFDEALIGGISKVKCFYNHGMDLHGRPSDTFSIPIGTPLDVRADGRGLRTITRFNEGAVGDQILEAIRNQAITGYSFRGPIRKSDPPRVRRVRDGDPLPTVTRMALGLTEYGPTPMPYYADANILALRSRISSLDDEKWDRLFHLLSASTPQDQEAVRTALSATPTEGPGAEDQRSAHSGRQLSDIARKIQRARILMEPSYEPEEA